MKPRIIIHNPTNFNTKKYRYYNIFFDKFVDILKTSFDIIENRYFIDAHKSRFAIKLLSDNTINNMSLNMIECEMILENYDSQHIKVLSVSDFLTEANMGILNSDIFYEYVDTILISQFNKKEIKQHSYRQNVLDIIKPWIYFPSNKYDLNYFFQKRKTLTLLDKFYFRGSGLEHRPLIKLFNSDLFFGGPPIGNFDNYANEAINYKVGFSCAGSAQLCYRDIEYMALGIPMLRFHYTNEMNPPLIPNYHYISVDPALEKNQEYILDITYAKIIEDKFLEIKNDHDFLNFISKNAREYYLNYIDENNGLMHTFNTLNLNDWI